MKNNFYTIQQIGFSLTAQKETITIIANNPKDAYKKWIKQSKGIKEFNFLKDEHNGKIYYKKDIFKNK